MGTNGIKVILSVICMLFSSCITEPKLTPNIGVHGTIKDSLSESAIENATIVVRSHDWRYGTITEVSDSAGYYFCRVPFGDTVSVICSKSGYGVRHDTLWIPGEGSYEIDFELVPQ